MKARIPIRPKGLYRLHNTVGPAVAILFIGLAGLPLGLSAQVLKLSQAEASRGERVTVEVSLHSPPSEQPSALQWETTFPSDRFSLVEGFPQAGPAAKESNKGVSCSTRDEIAHSQTILCFLYGGQKSVPDGVVAQFSFRISPKAPIGPARIRLDKGIAVSVDLKRTTIPSAEGVITVTGQ